MADEGKSSDSVIREDEEVMSEVHIGCPPGRSRPHVSHFTVSVPPVAGTGLVGLLLARVAQTVFLTDRGDEILDNCTKNVHLNCEVLNYKASIHVREVDWLKSWPPEVGPENSRSAERYSWSWTASEVEEAERSTFLVASDFIYSDDLTDALFSTLKRIMSRGSEKLLYLAMEKRYNFSFNNLDVVANGYSRFRHYLKNEEECGANDFIEGFVGKCIDLTKIPQYVSPYDRGDDLEIWQIKYIRESSSS